jgi:hypothetical protein
MDETGESLQWGPGKGGPSSRNVENSLKEGSGYGASPFLWELS